MDELRQFSIKRAATMTCKALAIFLLILGPSNFAAAAVIYENVPDHSVFTNYTDDHTHANKQPLGTGLVGTVKTLILWMADPSASSPSEYGPALYRCDDSSYSVGCVSYQPDQHENTQSSVDGEIPFVFPTPVILDPTKYYYFAVENGAACGGADGAPFSSFSPRCYGSAAQYNSLPMIDAPTLGSFYFIIDDSARTASTTTIISVVPSASSTIATSSAATIAATGWVTDADFVPGMKVVEHYQNNAYYSSGLVDVGFLGVAGAVDPSTSGTFTYDITSSGFWSFSTTTPLNQIGVYTLTTTVTEPRFSVLGVNIGSAAVVASTTAFTVATTTAFDKLQAQVRAEAAALGQEGKADGCNISFTSSFSLTGCLLFLFIPDQASIAIAGQRLHNDVFGRAPWGYVTRFESILTNTATTTLPGWTATIALNNASDTTTLTYDPADMLAGGAALLDSVRDPYNNKNDKDVLEPIVQLVVALGVLLTIIVDLLGSHKHEDGRNTKLS